MHETIITTNGSIQPERPSTINDYDRHLNVVLSEFPRHRRMIRIIDLAVDRLVQTDPGKASELGFNLFEMVEAYDKGLRQ